MNAKRTGPKKKVASGDDSNRWVLLYRIAWGLLFALLLFGIGNVFLPKSQSLRRYNQRRLELDAKNRRLEAENQELAEKLMRFKSEKAFVELTAREAGMIRTNEHTFRNLNARLR